MNWASIFDEKPERWGFRGDPYFWDYLQARAGEIATPSPEELEAWIKSEHLKVSGMELTDVSIAVVEQFAHGGMSSGGLSGEWWTEEGIPLLKRRLMDGRKA